MTDSEGLVRGGGPPTSLIRSAPMPAAKLQHTPYLTVAIIVAIILGLVLTSGVYYLENSRQNKVAAENNSLSTQVSALNVKIKQQTDINNGTVAPDKIYKDPAGGVGLVNGAITMTLPKGWVRVPQGYCTGGTIDSTAVCQDVTSVAPSSLVKPDGTASWSVNVGVFSYSSSDGTAKNWYETVYDHNPLSSYGSPEAINISTDPINGYSALSFQFVSPPLDNPDYTNAHFAVVHGKYAVEVDAQVQVSKEFGGGTVTDYRSTYLPAITQMMQSIKFQD